MTQKTLIILVGPSGSGKSTYAKENYPFAFVASTDDYFLTEDGDYLFNAKYLKHAHDYCFKAAQHAVETGEETVIIDNTNMRRWERKRYIELGLRHGYYVQVVFMPPVSADVCAKRNIHGTPLQIINRQIENLEF